jgi:hypothetical protein
MTSFLPRTRSSKREDVIVYVEPRDSLGWRHLDLEIL